MHYHMFGLLALTSTLTVTLTSATWTYEGTTVTLALVNYTYRDPRRDGLLVEKGQIGKYAPGQIASASGRVVVGGGHLAVNLNEVKGDCGFPWSAPSPTPAGSWVALVKKGGLCPDELKIEIAAASNASAVILYTSDEHAHLRKLAVEKSGLAVVWLGEEEGRSLAQVVEGGTQVVITLVPGHNLRYHVTSVNRTSVLFVSVSFIILMAISLAWLVFYYVQRFRYIHAKDRLARHLCNAAKKALAKIPVKTLKATDREITLDGECCAVCIEHYQAGESIRTLPCKHQFHRCCVDPWLLEHRTCPMCKMDILKHYGYVLSESEESVLQLDLGDGGEVGQTHSGRDTAIHTQAAHTPHHSAPHLTNVLMVSRSDGRGGMGGGGGRQEGVMGMERPFPDNPISPVHSSPSSLLSLQSPSKSLSTSLSSSVLSKSASSPPPHQEGDTLEEALQHTSDGSSLDLEVSSVCSGQCSANTTRPSTPVLAPHTPDDGCQSQDEAPLSPSPPPSPPRRNKRRSVPEVTAPNDSVPATLRPASHVVSVSHF